LPFFLSALDGYGTRFEPSAFFSQELNDGEAAMSVFVYIALFVAACGFGWWAKGADKGP
jgi:hypothetical protein